MDKVNYWEVTFKEYFDNIGRDFDINDDKASPKIFCTSINSTGHMETIPFTKKLREMEKNIKDDEKYDKAIKKLLNDGSIQYLEPGSSDIRVLQRKTITDQELANEMGIRVGEKALLADEPNYELGFFASLWQSIKSWFVDSAKVEIASRAYLENNPVRNVDLEKEKIEHNEMIRRRAEQSLNLNDMIPKLINNNKEIIPSDRKQLENRVQKWTLFGDRVMSVFGTKPNNRYFPADGMNPIDVKALPEIPSKIDNLDITEKNLAYLGLCMGIGSYQDEPAAAYRLQETVIDKCLASDSNNYASEDFCNVINEGRKNAALLGTDVLDSTSALDSVGAQVRKGIQALNQMLNTAHPSDIINPDSNCFAASKIVKEVISALDKNPSLKGAVNLMSQDYSLAKGGSELYDILSSSHKAQQELFTSGRNSGSNGKIVAREAKFRGACAVNELASYGAEKLSRLKNMDATMNFNDKMDLYEEIYPKKAANSMILKLADNKDYFDEGATVTELEEKILHLDLGEMSTVLLHGVKAEAEIQSKKLISKMNNNPENAKKEASSKTNGKKTLENNDNSKTRSTN